MCSNDIVQELSQHGRVYTHIPMSKFTTFKVGGPADILIEPYNNDTIPSIVTIAKQVKMPVAVIGGGSNIVVGDKGIRGLVLRIGSSDDTPGAIIIQDAIVTVDARSTKKFFVNQSLEHGLEGMEFMSGIPGCIGGGIVMNAGTAMGTFSDIVSRITFYNMDGTLQTIGNETLFSYRKSMLPDEAIVISAECKLKYARNMQDGVRSRNKRGTIA